MATLTAQEHMDKAAELSSPEAFMNMVGERLSTDKNFAEIMEAMKGIMGPGVEVPKVKAPAVPTGTIVIPADIGGPYGKKSATPVSDPARSPPLNPAVDRAVEFKEVEIEPRDFVFVHAVIPDAFDLFRGMKIIAAESVPQATSMFLIVAHKFQAPLAGKGSKTDSFAANNLGSGVKFDTWQRGQSFCFMVWNGSDKPVKWSAAVYGKAVKSK